MRHPNNGHPRGAPTIKTINVTCNGRGCGRPAAIPAREVVLIRDGAAVLALFFCENCGAGWSRHETPAARELLLHSGAEVGQGLRPARA